MGAMIKLAGDEDAPKPSTPALPTEKEKGDGSPLLANRRGLREWEGARALQNEKEQDEVDAVLKNEELRELLMNPAAAAVLGPAGLPGGDARSREPGHHREARAGGGLVQLQRRR